MRLGCTLGADLWVLSFSEELCHVLLVLSHLLKGKLGAANSHGQHDTHSPQCEIACIAALTKQGAGRLPPSLFC